MKKIISILLLISFLVLPIGVLAAAEMTVPADLDVIQALKDITDWMFTILVIIASLFLIIGGLTFVTAGGDPEKVKKAQQSLQWALIGVVVALLSKGLVVLVGKMVGKTLVP